MVPWLPYILGALMLPLGWWVGRAAGQKGWANRALVPLVLGISVTATVTASIERFPSDWNSVRTVIPVALTRGLPIYAHEGVGALWCNIYPPLGHVLLTPVALASTPDGVIAIGQVLTLFYVLVPLVLVGLRGRSDGALTHERGPGWVRIRHALMVATMIFWATACLPPLTDITTLVHIDAPGICLSLLAVLLCHRRTIASLLFSGVFAAGAVFCKQTLTAVPLAMAIWLMIQHDWRGLGRFITSATITGFVMGAACVSIFSFGPLWTNLVVVPSKHPIAGGFAWALSDAVKSSALLLFPLHGLAFWTLFLRHGPSRRSRLSTFLLMCAVAQVPFAFSGFMKFGGGANNLALTGVFFLGSVIAFPWESWHRSRRTGTETNRSGWGVVVLTVALGAAIAAQIKWSRSPENQNPGPSPHHIAYTVIRQSPGRWYFPWYPLSHLLAEDRATHHSWGLLDRTMAGRDISPEWFQSYIPPNAYGLAYRTRPDRFDIPYQRLQGMYPFLYPPTLNPPELQGWLVYGKGNW